MIINGPAAKSVAGRVPPHDLDAEAAVLSSILHSAEALYQVGGWLKPEHFYSDDNRAIYETALDLAQTGQAIDVITTNGKLRDVRRPPLGCKNWAEYLGMLVDATPAVLHVEDHATNVVEKAKARAGIRCAQQFAAEGYDVKEVGEWLASGVVALAHIAEEGNIVQGVPGDVAVRALFDRYQNPDLSAPMRTGNPDLDRLMRGLRRKNLVIIGAHSGVGKSALATNIATHVLLREQREHQPSGVLIFSLEMGADEYIERMACSMARVDSKKLDPEHRATMTREEGQRFIASMNDLGKPHLIIDERSDITMAQVRATARKVAAQFRRVGTPLSLIVIDYAQIVSASSDTRRRSENREQEVAVVGRESKKMAKELDITVLLLAQLNDDSAKEKRKPRVKDLRESKALLQDADKVVLIHNPNAVVRAEAYANGDAVAPDPDQADEVDLIVGKHRGGPTGTIRALYWPTYTTFGAYAHAT